MERFGEIIRIERLIRRMSQEELGEKIGVSRNSIGCWENGRKEPGTQNLIRLAAELNLDFEFLKECFCN